MITKTNIKRITPFVSDVSDRLLYNAMIQYSLENQLLFPKLSGFKPGKYCINCLNCERSVFDISKAFDKIWQEHIYKPRHDGILDNLFKFHESFLDNTEQLVVLNIQCLN